MQSKFMTRAALLASAVSMVAVSVPAAAQDYPGGPPPGYGQQQPPPGYNDGPPPGYNGGPPPDDNDGPPPGYNGPPPGYNGGPPPGYNGGPNGGYYDAQPQGPPPGYGAAMPPPPGYDGGPPSPQQQTQDQQYAAYAQQWAQENCVKSHGDVAAGAIAGGIFGAVIGGITGGRRGVAIGAGLGGVGGAAVAADSEGATSPGCPPGYVVRDGAPGFYYQGSGPYDYYAPADYNPWVWWGNAWVFRPYPYHSWYYRHYGRGGHYRHY